MSVMLTAPPQSLSYFLLLLMKVIARQMVEPDTGTQPWIGQVARPVPFVRSAIG